MKRILLLVFAIIIIGSSFFVYNEIKQKNMDKSQTDITNIKIDNIRNIENNINGYAIISKEEATKLVSEQIDLNQYTISLSDNIFKKDESEYYLFDIINKTQISFSEQIAVNTKTGELLTFIPEKKELRSMSEFPINTSIAQTQEWSGDFVYENEGDVNLKLLQADQHSFEFILYKGNNEKEQILFGIGKVDGSKATYIDEEIEILFIKNDDVLNMNIICKDENMTKLSGSYKQID